MKLFCFDLSVPFRYHWAGKFRSPNDEWMHLTRRLTDFELMVVTDGILHIADGSTEYAVQTGEYLLMAPSRKTRKPGNSIYKRGHKYDE